MRDQNYIRRLRVLALKLDGREFLDMNGHNIPGFK